MVQLCSTHRKFDLKKKMFAVCKCTKTKQRHSKLVDKLWPILRPPIAPSLIPYTSPVEVASETFFYVAPLCHSVDESSS